MFIPVLIRIHPFFQWCRIRTACISMCVGLSNGCRSSFSRFKLSMTSPKPDQVFSPNKLKVSSSNTGHLSSLPFKPQCLLYFGACSIWMRNPPCVGVHLAFHRYYCRALVHEDFDSFASRWAPRQCVTRNTIRTLNFLNPASKQFQMNSVKRRGFEHHSDATCLTTSVTRKSADISGAAHLPQIKSFARGDLKVLQLLRCSGVFAFNPLQKRRISWLVHNPQGWV